MLSALKASFLHRKFVSKYRSTSSNFVMNSIADFSTLQIGLTGSIGMGKSTVANQLKLLGFPVFDADHHVHSLYSSGGAAVEPISLVFPHVIVDNSVNRIKLMQTVLSSPTALKDIEQIVHPLVMSARQQFYRDASEQGHFMVVYDIPLLFENKAKHDVDYTIVVTANPNTQKERVLNRKGMTVEKFESMLSKQMSDAEKRALADFIIHTDYQTFVEAKSQLATIIEKIIDINGDKWAAWKNRNRLALIHQQPAAHHSAALSASDFSPLIPSPSLSVDVPSSSSSSAPVFDMLLFDLDDTLSPTAKQLGLAYRAMTAFMDTHMPLSCADMKAHYVEIASRVKAENPLIVHDLNELRVRAMRLIAQKHGEEDMVQGAMEAFFEARNDLEKNLFDDVLECFRWATSQGMKIGILTNGTADLSRCTQLLPFISVYLTAAELGVCKPSPVAFIAGIHKSGFLPKRILYVGDSYEHDVLGAKNAGMYSAWLVRNSDGSSAKSNCKSQQVAMASANITTTSSIPSNAISSTTSNSTSSSTSTSSTNHFSPIEPCSPLSPAALISVATGDERGLMIERAESPPGRDFSLADIVLNSLHPVEFEEKIRKFVQI